MRELRVHHRATKVAAFAAALLSLRGVGSEVAPSTTIRWAGPPAVVARQVPARAFTPFHRNDTDASWQGHTEFEAGVERLSAEWDGVGTGNLTVLLSFMKKLAYGEPTRITVIGGSFPEGKMCEQIVVLDSYLEGIGRSSDIPYKSEEAKTGKIIVGKRCSYVARVEAWLRAAFPATMESSTSVLRFENLAAGGSPLPFFLSDLQTYVHKDTDLLIIDSMLNDEVIPEQPIASNGKTIMAANHEVAATALEQTFRKLAKLAPNAVPLGMICVGGSYNKQKKNAVRNAELEIYKRYGVPWIDITAINALFTGGSLWPVPGSHPPWYVHQRVADTVASLLTHVWISGHTLGREPPVFARHVMEETAGWHDQFASVAASEPRWGAPYTDLFRGCDEPLSRYSAFDYFALAEGGNRIAPRVIKGNWSLYEDRPQKPGWMATDLKSTISFKLRFGSQPRIVINYLASYANFGVVRMTAPGNRRTFIDAKWEEQFSQTATRIIPAFSVFAAKPGSEFELEFELFHHHKAGDRFKIIEVLSC